MIDWERLPDLKSKSQQRNVVLHPEFVDGKYALYTRPQDGFIDAGSGGGIGWSLIDDITNASILSEQIIDKRHYHTIKEVKNGEGPHPIKTPAGWLHLAHGVRGCAAGLRYVLYLYMTSLEDPTKVIAQPGGYFMAPVGEERTGDVSNVLFSNGWIADEDGAVFIYYASSDTRMHVATSTIDKLVDYCMNTPADGLSSSASDRNVEEADRQEFADNEIIKIQHTMATLKEKIGMVLGICLPLCSGKIFSYYLPFFYSNIFGLSLADAGLLMLVTRIWDAVSDPMMGVIADRTHTRWGKYRPYLLWIAAPFAIAGILLFTTPDMGTTGKLVWAYVTYILMMTVYTAINVPYGAMLGVMTDDSNTKTVFSSYRMFFAYGGSFIALGAWEPLCNWFKSMDYSNASSWQYAMVCIATLCFLGFLFCFSMTREHVKSVASESIGKDVKSLVRNSPWWILNGAALLSNFFNTVRGATAAYFFKDYISANAFLDFGVFNLVLYAGLFLMVGEVCNMIGVALAVPLSMKVLERSPPISFRSCAW